MEQILPDPIVGLCVTPPPPPTHLDILDICEESGRDSLLFLGDGGSELALLDMLEPSQLLHAEHGLGHTEF
jgi:hypothetical protein